MASRNLTPNWSANEMNNDQPSSSIGANRGVADNVEHVAHDVSRVVASAVSIAEELKTVYVILVRPLLAWAKSGLAENRQNVTETLE
ncbi:hypothetical protein [Marisediminicola sp. LYQ85]|uniref:hypothetical protein n=1 Tax=Marisediminicola sp. LYQ85 TaxID=3391062 RepID=UPI003983D7BF